MLHRGQQLSAATARNDLAITEWRLSARSAGSDDVRDDSQPLDRADQAATARDGMCQLWMSLLIFILADDLHLPSLTTVFFARVVGPLLGRY